MAAMPTPSAPEFRYEPRYCTFFGKHVWAIRTRQSDGSWRVVNCLDKDEACFRIDCVFTTSGGMWPYALPAEPPGNAARVNSP